MARVRQQVKLFDLTPKISLSPRFTQQRWALSEVISGWGDLLFFSLLYSLLKLFTGFASAALID